MEPLAPSPLGRRWRWALHHRGRLVAAGWQLGAPRAERSLRTAASRAAHELAGIHALRPERSRMLGAFIPGVTVTVDCGAVSCVLTPATARDAAAAA